MADNITNQPAMLNTQLHLGT